MSGCSGNRPVFIAPDFDCGSGLATAMTYTCRGDAACAQDAFAFEASLLQARVEARL
jgi:hypothetical protein